MGEKMKNEKEKQTKFVDKIKELPEIQRYCLIKVSVFPIACNWCLLMICHSQTNPSKKEREKRLKKRKRQAH